MKILFEIIYNSDRFINILAVAITAAMDLITFISFIKSSEKRAVKLFIIIFSLLFLLYLYIRYLSELFQMWLKIHIKRREVKF